MFKKKIRENIVMFLTIISVMAYSYGRMAIILTPHSPLIAYDAIICVLLAGLCHIWAGPSNHACQTATIVNFCKPALIPKSGTRNPTYVRFHSQPSQLCGWLSADMSTNCLT